MSNSAENKTYCGFVAVIGLPNVGKSTFLNRLLGYHLNIASPKVHTTRQRLKGILTQDEFQVIFIDTPGWHESEEELHKFMIDEIEKSLKDADLVIMISDAWSYEQERQKVLFSRIDASFPEKSIKVFNKIDVAEERQFFNKKSLNDEGYIAISSKPESDIETLLSHIFRRLPESPFFYDDHEILTDQPMRFLAAELVREQIYLCLYNELPYSIAVSCTEYLEAKDGRKTEIHVDIIVERESQKKIVIGKEGQSIKRIGKMARKQIEKNLGGEQIVLKTRVKVDPNWTSKSETIKKYGYI